MTYYKALDGLKSCHGGFAAWEPGRWMPWVKEVIPCKQGYHVCDGEEQLLLWMTSDIWTAEVKGEVVNLGDKVFVHQVRIVEKTAWNTDSAIKFAQDCANHVKHIDSYYSIRAAILADYATCSATRDAVDTVAYAAAAAADAGDTAATRAAERRWQAERLGKYLRGEL